MISDKEHMEELERLEQRIDKLERESERVWEMIRKLGSIIE